MLKSIVIKVLLAIVLTQQAIGSKFVVVKVDKVTKNNIHHITLSEFTQNNNGYDTTLKRNCMYGVGTKDLFVFDKLISFQVFDCEKYSNAYAFKGVGTYLTSLHTNANMDYPCIRVDESYKFITYICSYKINKDLIEVPISDTTINKPSSIPTPSTIIFKASSTPVPTCTKGHCGLKAGTGKTGACCSSSDDCLDTCNSNGKCGVSDMTGEPKTDCPT